MAENIMLNLGIGLDGDEAITDAKEVYEELSDVLGKTLNVNINSNDIDNLALAIKNANGQINIVRDNISGLATELSASWEDANGQLIKYVQNLNSVKNQETGIVSYNVTGSSYTVQNKGTRKEDLAYIKEYYDIKTKLMNLDPQKDSLWAELLNRELQKLEPKINEIKVRMSFMNEEASSSYKDIAEAISQGNSKIENSLAKSFDKSIFNDYNKSVKEVSSAINELYSAQNKLVSTKSGPESNTYKTLSENVESAKQKLDEAVASLQKFDQAQHFALNDSVANGIHTITSEYQGQDEALKKLNEQLEAKNKNQVLSSAKKQDSIEDVNKINAAVEALKKLNDARYDYEKMKLSGSSSDQLDAQIRKIQELESNLNSLKQVQLSSNQTVEQDSNYRSKQSTAYGELNQELKQLNSEYKNANSSLGQLDSSMASNLANVIAMSMSYQTLQQAMVKIVDTAKELDAAMTDIQIVTQMSDSDASALMQSYSQIAKELGTTTTAVAASSSEWLCIRSL